MLITLGSLLILTSCANHRPKENDKTPGKDTVAHLVKDAENKANEATQDDAVFLSDMFKHINEPDVVIFTADTKTSPIKLVRYWFEGTPMYTLTFQNAENKSHGKLIRQTFSPYYLKGFGRALVLALSIDTNHAVKFGQADIIIPEYTISNLYLACNFTETKAELQLPGKMAQQLIDAIAREEMQ